MYLPRERVKEKGVEALSDYELLALIFRTGSKEDDVISLSKKLLEKIGGFGKLGNATVSSLCHVPGIGESKACAIIASLEIGKRVFQYEKLKKSIQVTSPLDCVEYFKAELKFEKQEVFIVVFLNTKNQVISFREIFRGGLQSVEVHPREIFKVAFELSAASIILIHNHPSEDPTPSEADFRATATLCKVGEVMGIQVVDHIIIGGNSYESLRAMGKIS